MTYKILFIGPAAGHNIMPFVNYFNRRKIKTLFLYTGELDNGWDSDHIDFLKYSNDFLKSLFQVRKVFRDNSFSFVWYQGGTSFRMLLLILLFKRKGQKFNLNIWSERFPLSLSKKNVRNFIHKILLRKVTVIQCNWFSTFNQLKSTGLSNLYLQPWGLEYTFINVSNEEPGDFIRSFLKTIPVNKTIFFWPKSILKDAGHDLVIEACRILLQENINDYVVYFWVGNTVDENLNKEYLSLIIQHGLGDNIKVITHPFVTFSEMRAVWEKMDYGINIARKDQLTTAVLESLFCRKDIILSNIESYRYLNYLYDLRLNLIENNVNKIAYAMKIAIMNDNRGGEILNYRKKIIQDNFLFNDNVDKVMDFIDQI